MKLFDDKYEHIFMLGASSEREAESFPSSSNYVILSYGLFLPKSITKKEGP
jgi:hypothetical protein